MANGEAIGLIETKGIVAAVEACDAALKAANVEFVEQHQVGSGLIANTGRAIVAIDVVGAGEGQLVLIVQGSSARMTDVTKNLPADAVIVGIVDSAQYAGKTFYQTK